MVFGQPVYNTEQRRAILGQMKQYLDKEWLRRRAAGLTKKIKKFDTIRFPITKKRKRRRKRIKRNYLRPFRVKIIRRRRRRRRRRR